MAAAAAANRRDEMANIRQISRQQLANALANVTSFNSLSNIAQRNADEALHGDEGPRSSSSAPLVGVGSGSAAGAGSSSGASGTSSISSELFRNELARAFQSLSQHQPAVPPVESMEVESGGVAAAAAAPSDDVDDDDDGDAGDDSDVLPRCYRRHRFTEQLRTMAAMGFINHTQNVNYLTLADGNVEHAINLLMLGMN